MNAKLLLKQYKEKQLALEKLSIELERALVDERVFISHGEGGEIKTVTDAIVNIGEIAVSCDNPPNSFPIGWYWGDDVELLEEEE